MFLPKKMVQIFLRWNFLKLWSKTRRFNVTSNSDKFDKTAEKNLVKMCFTYICEVINEPFIR